MNLLKDDFFTVSDLVREDMGCKASLTINADHSILLGHFPGHPVVPGVCMVQMVKELLEFQLHAELRMVSSDQIKFLAIIDPRLNAMITADISYSIEDSGRFKVNAILSNEDIIYFKLQGAFFEYK